MFESSNRIKRCTSTRPLKVLSWFGLLCIALNISGLQAEGDAAAGKALFPVCTACHGPQGQGNAGMQGPKIAGATSWYFIQQMKLFQQGARGGVPGDVFGANMANIAKGPQFTNDKALADLAAYVATLPDTPAPITIQGDAQNGENLYRVCAACHGQAGEGNQQMSGPRLAGMNDWYLVSQLKKYKANQRGYHPADTGGVSMKPMANTLPDDKAINDVVAYINTLR